VWKTDSPQTRERLQASYQRDRVVRRIPLTATVRADVGQAIVISVDDGEGHAIEVAWDGPLQAAMKHPLTEATFREQFGRLGDSPFELKQISGLENPSRAMVPKSVLNDLRRDAVQRLLVLRSAASSVQMSEVDLLHHVAEKITARYGNRFASSSEPQLNVLVRTMEQLQAVLAWTSPADGQPLAGVYCDFEDVRKYKQAVAEAKAAQRPIGLATIRIVKPGEEGLLRHVADCAPDFVLVRNLAGLSYFSSNFPHIPMVGDYSLNIANEVTASIIADAGVCRMVPSYDLSWKQLAALIGRFPASAFETVIHQHMPMFHMEHCVFAHTLSDGSDYRTCGRPCDSHQVDLRDRAGAKHPLMADVGCRNTVFNAAAQSAAEFIPRMKNLGVSHFRIELLRESATQAIELLNRYWRVIAGIEDGRATWRQLRVLNQLGVTRGTLED
jgi:U32 family peptidase